VQLGIGEHRRRSQAQLGSVERLRHYQLQLGSRERHRRVGLESYFTFFEKNSAINPQISRPQMFVLICRVLQCPSLTVRPQMSRPQKTVLQFRVLKCPTSPVAAPVGQVLTIF
jgi:hypothetical protein